MGILVFELSHLLLDPCIYLSIYLSIYLYMYNMYIYIYMYVCSYMWTPNRNHVAIAMVSVWINHPQIIFLEGLLPALETRFSSNSCILWEMAIIKYDV